MNGDGNVLESGKDGTIWIKLQGDEPKVRKLSQNVLKHIPGPTREAKARILTPFDTFKCIVDITMITYGLLVTRNWKLLGKKHMYILLCIYVALYCTFYLQTGKYQLLKCTNLLHFCLLVVSLLKDSH